MLKEQNLEIVREANQLEITYRWRTKMAYALLFFALVWNGFLGIFLLAGAGWFISVHAAVGLGMGYYALALLLNKSTITVNRQHVTVEHGPLPTFLANRDLWASEVKQLHLKRGGTVRSGNQVTQLYALRLETKDGRDLKVLSGLPDLQLGQTIERAVEEYLGIEDEAADDSFTLPDLGVLEKFIPAHVRREMVRAGRTLQTDETEAGRVMASLTPRPTTATLSPPEAHAEHLSYDFALCHAPVGARFTVKDAPYRLTERSTLRWSSGPESLDLRAAPEAAGPPRQFYAVPDGNQWAYFEERTLDSEESASLGFTEAEPPVSLRNGDDRYHLLDHRTGVLQGTYGEVPTEQYTYFSSRSAARFRALRVSGGRWTVMIQQPVDSSYIEAIE